VTRFLCIGDLHAGAHLGYGRTPQERLDDQEQTLNRCVDLAIEHDVDAVLLAGDLWDARKPTPAALMAVVRPLRRLRAELGCDILAIPGNHDVEAAGSALALDLLEDIVDVHREPGIWQTRGCSVVTLPWAPGVNRLVAARDGGDRDETHDLGAQLLLRTAADLRAQVDGPAVLLLHWSISGASTPTGILTDEFSEVVLDVDALDSLGFDAVVAGHIHKPQTLYGGPHSERSAFYVGSPAPVDFGEAESDHGCYLLEVDEEAARLQFLPVESRCFLTLDFDHEDPFAQMALSHQVGWDVEDAVVRVRYTATEEQARRIDHAEITRALLEAGAHRVWAIEAKVERATRARVEVAEDLSPLAAFDLYAEASEIAPDLAAAARARLAEHLEAVA
jgi:DNA repair protein SbcD/Mre11